MMALVGPTAVLAIAISGFLLILGVPVAARRLLLGTLAIAILIPLAGNIGNCFSGSVGVHWVLLVALVALLLIILVLVVLVRYVNHKRQLYKWLGSKPTSLKRRVDRGP